MYKQLIRPILFRIEPEKVHDNAIILGISVGESLLKRAVLYAIYDYRHSMLTQTIHNIKFRNPVGLSAGFDKNGLIIDAMSSLGFGFTEIGSVTAREYKGNPKPRLTRLPKDHAIAVNYGLKSEGVIPVYNRLRGRTFSLPVGISIAKTNDDSIKGDKSVDDYLISFKFLSKIADYITLNISCPNTGDGRSFEDVTLLKKLLVKMGNHRKTVFLKISADIQLKQLDEIINLCDRYKISGFVVSNLTKNRRMLNTSRRVLDNVKGGISGEPVRARSNKLIRYIYRNTEGRYTIIGVGGIFSPEDAYEKILNGASLVQLITGMIYEGPYLIKRINKGLVSLLKKDGFSHISEAIGKSI